MNSFFCDCCSFLHAPSATQLGALSAAEPENVFYTLSYAKAREQAGDEVWLFQLNDGLGGTRTFPVFVQRGRLTSALEIPSYPDVDDDRVLAAALRYFGGTQGISRFSLGTFGSHRSPDTDCWPQNAAFRRRGEFVLRLGGNMPSSVSKAHLRNLKKAQSRRLLLDIASSKSARHEHAALFSSSMLRRKNRGEHIDLDFGTNFLDPFLDAGAGSFFRAVAGGEVYSSLFLLFGPKGAYYFSSGTSEEGRRTGAAQFLVLSAARELAARGFTCFNLGGAHEEGLQRFKSGFGAEYIPLLNIEISSPRSKLHLAASRCLRLFGRASRHESFELPHGVEEVAGEK